ncbi:MAG: glutamate--tRNA ligase [Micavibrio sp.]|nr:glutamate--tRNA ligase [Micavibrio sp.]
MAIRTRFAPSPTGALHIGGARTALFSWLYAKKHHGEFLLRIEDTDRARSTEENTKIILDSLKWLGLDFDGEPISQFENAKRHAEVAHEMVKNGDAYYCYTSQAELEAMRSAAEAKGEHFRYPGTWRDKSPTEAPAGVDPVVRIKARQSGDMTVHDAVQGDVTIQNKELDDFIILRADGTPTYLLSVVVDDHDMKITHVIRGDDHLTNTFKQKLIYEAMGWKNPIFAHIPLIHGADGKKMSKRHGATGVDDYIALGILPEAMRNYLLKLGWSHGDDEIISDEHALELFDIDGIGRAPARFDLDKLRFLNAHYIKEKADDALVSLIMPVLQKHTGSELSCTARMRLLKGMPDLKDRAKDLNELAEAAAFYVEELPLPYEDKAKDILKDADKDMLSNLATLLEHLETFQADDIDALCKRMSEENDIKLKDIMMPLRAALTGRSQSPHLAKVAEVFGKDETVKRLRAVL